MALGAVGVVLALVLGSATPGTPSADAATGAERVPAVCVANIYAGIETLNVGVLVPDFPPFWDVSPPVGAYAHATGYAVFTPSGAVNVTCNAAPNVWSDGSASWPSGRFRGSSSAFTARGGEGVMGEGALVYAGRATVTLDGTGSVTISAHLKYAYTQGPAG